MFLNRFIAVFALCTSLAHAVEIKNDALVEKIGGDVTDNAKKLIVNGIDPNAKTDELTTIIIELLKPNLKTYDDAFIASAESKIKSEIGEVLLSYKNDLGLYDSTKAIYNKRFFLTLDKTIKETIENLLSDTKEEVINVKIDQLDEKISTLKGIEHKKLLRLGADVDFLYAATFGSSNYFWSVANDVSDQNIKIDNKKVKKIEFNTYWKDAVILDDNANTEVNDPLFVLQAKLEAVENALVINTDSKNMDLKARVDSVNKKLNNPDWESDNITFGAYVAHVNDADTIAVSAAMHAYFGYRRFLPGDYRDLARRLSFMFAVGTPIQTSGTGGVEGPIYTVGMGFDIQKGVTLSAGYSIYSYRPTDTGEFSNDNSISIGLTLNSDFWSGLSGQ